MNEKVLQAVIKLKDEFTKPLKGIKSSMEELGKQVDKSKKELSNFNTGMQTVGKTAVAVGGTLTAALGGAFYSCTKEAIEFESAFTGVVKTLGDKLSGAGELDAMRSSILELSTRLPRTANEIAKVAEIGGQLNVPVENITKFTETIIRLADSTDITLEDGTLALAKFMGVAKVGYGDVDKLGSVIVALGNNSQTTESAILSMASRLSGLNALADFNAQQIMGWSTGLSSAGIEAEMGGSAFTKMVSEIQRSVSAGGDAVSDFAKIAQMDITSFSNLFKQDASSAVYKFIEGLGKIKEGGGDLTATLDDLGFDEVRLRATTIALASSYKGLSGFLNLASDAWKDNEALMKESSTRYATTASAIQLMKNQISVAKIEIGNAFLPVIANVTTFIGGLAAKFNKLDEGTRKAIITVGMIVLGFGVLLTIGGTLLIFVSSVSAAFVALGGAAGIAGMAVAFLTSPFWLVIGVIVLVIANIRMLKKNWDANLFGIQEKTKKVISTVTGWFKTFIDFITRPIHTAVTVTKTVIEGAKKIAGKKKDGSHAFGMSRVPRDGYVAQLHQGEKVLTKQEADKQEKGFAGGINININEMSVREEADIEKIAREIARNLKSQRLAFAGGGN